LLLLLWDSRREFANIHITTRIRQNTTGREATRIDEEWDGGSCRCAISAQCCVAVSAIPCVYCGRRSAHCIRSVSTVTHMICFVVGVGDIIAVDVVADVVDDIAVGIVDVVGVNVIGIIIRQAIGCGCSRCVHWSGGVHSTRHANSRAGRDDGSSGIIVCDRVIGAAIIDTSWIVFSQHVI